MRPAVRRPLFLHGGLQMLACYVTLAALLGVEFRKCGVPKNMCSLQSSALMSHLIVEVLSAQCQRWQTPLRSA